LAIGLTGCLEQTAQLPAPSLNDQVNEQPGLIVRIEEIIIGLLLVSALVGLVAQRIGIPYTIGLVVVGFARSFLPQIAPYNITPDIILALLTHPLVYEAAFLLNYNDLNHDLRVVLTLAL
jgi:NhaP-type Na+/H+ or K+/H+ antiporter